MKLYTYTRAHVKALDRYRTIKLLFLLLGCLTLLLQSICWLIVWNKGISVSTTDMVFVTITLIAAFLFVLSQLFFAVRNNKIIKEIDQTGECRYPRYGESFFRKRTIASGLALFMRIISVVFLILLGILIINFIRDYLNWGKVILKLPLMMLIVVEVVNISAEIRHQTMLTKVDQGK